MNLPPPGKIALLGSGETGMAGGKVFEQLSAHLPRPLHAAVMETPAGFELNAQAVAGRISEFLRLRLQHCAVQVSQIAARHKAGSYSPDLAEIVEPLYTSDLIFLGPGSPTYTARHLADSLAWEIIRARQRVGAALVLASAAAIAAGRYALPVYEIYKAGLDPFWAVGLDLLSPYGLDLVIIPHWNNTDGGSGLDTSRCFMGQGRFETLLDRLPAETILLGLDENTAALIDLNAQSCAVVGSGALHILRSGRETDCPTGSHFPLTWLGVPRIPSQAELSIRPQVWQRALATTGSDSQAAAETPPDSVLDLLSQRAAARAAKDWPASDRLRQQLASQGWAVQDTSQGQVASRLK